MWQYADRQGYMWFNAACSPANVPGSKPMPPDPFFRSKFYCPGTINGYRNVKMTKLGGKDVIYAESSQGEARIENWFNLKPFYIMKSVTHSPDEPVVTMHHTVQINENIDSDIFAMPKK